MAGERATAGKIDPETLALRATPRRVVRFKRRLMIGIAGLAIAGILGVTWLALRGPVLRFGKQAQELYNTDRKSSPDGLAGLPKDYGEIKKCAHCGCALLAEIKKGKYVYYCTGFKGKCGEPYVREEVLEQQFGQHLARLGIDQEVSEWIVRALRESCSDEKREHNEAIARLQAEWDRLQKRIDAMYVDKLDGRIEEGFHTRTRAQWRDEQERCERDIERHRAADDFIWIRVSRSSAWARTPTGCSPHSPQKRSGACRTS